MKIVCPHPSDSNFMRFPSHLRVNIAIAVCLLFVSLLNGCTSDKKNKPQAELVGYKQTGLASYYAKNLHHRMTASGELFDNDAMTAAHKTLPFGTEVIVTNLSTGKSVTVRINDRGPYIKGRIIDLTRAAFSQIADLDKGVAKAEIRAVK